MATISCGCFFTDDMREVAGVCEVHKAWQMKMSDFAYKVAEDRATGDETILLRGILAQAWEELIVARNSGWDQEQFQDIIDSLGVALSAYPSTNKDLVAAGLALNLESGSSRSAVSDVVDPKESK